MLWLIIVQKDIKNALSFIMRWLNIFCIMRWPNVF